jgi:hypothetical protein
MPRTITGHDFDENLDDREWRHMERVAEGLLTKCDTLVKVLALRNDRVDYSIVILSSVTSGGLWLLAAELLPKITSRIGAITSTAVSFLTIYSLMSGVGRRRKNFLKLRASIADFLADIRGRNYRPTREFWNEVKWFDSTLMILERSRDD